MKKFAIFLFAFLYSANAMSEYSGGSAYEIAFQDGGITCQADGFESRIKLAFDILLKLEKLNGKEIDEVKNVLIRNIDADLSTLGHMIANVDKKTILSPMFYEYMEKESARLEKSFQETLGKEKADELDASAKAKSKAFWQYLKKYREENKWALKYKNEKLRTLVEADIELAFNRFIEYGNIYKSRY